MLAMISGNNDVDMSMSTISNGGSFDGVYCGEAVDYNQPRVNAYACGNQTWIQGSMIVDTGCQSTIQSTIYEPFLQDMIESEALISGFDGSEQNGSKYGHSFMYFMHHGTPTTGLPPAGARQRLPHPRTDGPAQQTSCCPALLSGRRPPLGPSIRSPSLSAGPRAH